MSFILNGSMIVFCVIQTISKPPIQQKMDLTDFLKRQMQSSLSPGMVSELSRQLGTDPANTGKAASSAMGALLSALARNAATPSGAASLSNALEKDNHGGLLDMLAGALSSGKTMGSTRASEVGMGDLGGILTSMLGGSSTEQNKRAANGGGILEHILGRRKEDTAAQIGQSSGIGAGNALKLMGMLAPIVMGMLGKTKSQGNLNADGLGGLLDSFMRTNVQPGKPAAQTNLGLAGRLLDRDGDGSAVDDIAGMIGGFLFNRR